MRAVLLAIAACSHPQAEPLAERGARPTALERFRAHEQAGRPPSLGECATEGVDKACATDADCASATIVVDGCGSTARVGVRAGSRAAAAAPKPAAGSSCTAWNFSEDCGLIENEALVACVDRRCLTHAP